MKTQTSKTVFTKGDAIFFSAAAAVIVFIGVVGYHLVTSGATIMGIVE